MKVRTPFQTRCGRCESEDLCINGPCATPHCVECNYKPDCPECFDSKTVDSSWALGAGATGTCGDCS